MLYDYIIQNPQNGFIYLNQYTSRKHPNLQIIFI
ncbi:hypothetical protein pb186bvf_002328 [Paramecium bursaria]